MTKSFRDLFLISSCLSFIASPAQSANKLEVLDSYFFAELASDDENELRTKPLASQIFPTKFALVG